MTNNHLSLKCSKCNHIWNYNGNSKYFATCSYCRKLARIEKNKAAVSERTISPTAVTN